MLCLGYLGESKKEKNGHGLSSFNLIEFDSFWNIWFWVMVVVSWSVTCHWTIGVPFDLIVLANRYGGKWADQCEMVAQANIDRMCYYIERGGVYFIAVIAFFIAILATFGFYFDMEFSKALTLLLTPLIAVQFLGARLAVKARNNGWEGKILRKALTRRRFWNQVIGVTSVFMLSVFAFIHVVMHDNIIYFY